MNGDRRSDLVVVVAVIVLGAIVMTSITGITIVAVATDRDVTFAEQLAAGAVLLIALLGGLIVRRWESRP